MTFYEAAVEVLREAGRPLHYKKITEISIRRSLLSHVGKTPEITMGARLNQEIRKSDEGTLIREVRPGVFALKEGSDPTEARETIRLREPVAEDDEDEDDDLDEGSNADHDDASDDDDDDDDDESDDEDEDDTSDDGDDDEINDKGENRSRSGRRRRRRGRRGGRNRQRRSDDDEDESAKDGEDEDESATAAPERPSPRASREQDDAPARETQRPPRKQESRRDSHRSSDSVPTATDDGLAAAGEFARILVGIFEDEKKDVLSLRQLAAILARRNFGAAGRLDPAIIRGGLQRANQRCTAAGWPPLFVEVRPERWTLATASGQELADSYTALASWQREHRNTLRAALAGRLRSLDGDAVAAIVTLLLERLGHHDLQRNEKLGREHSTISANLDHGLTSSRVAVRIADPQQRLNREDVIAFRGSLHNYGADDGAIVSVAGFEGDARSEAIVPNLPNISLIGGDELADQLIDSGVGVESFRVDVSCVDESFFGAFGGERD